MLTPHPSRPGSMVTFVGLPAFLILLTLVSVALRVFPVSPSVPRPTTPPQATLLPRAVTFVAATPEEARAIAAAERFVAENGYTAAPANLHRMVPELLQNGLPKPIIEQMRRATLYPKAYGISPEQGLHGPGWTVFFEFTRGSGTLAGVEMSPDLQRVWMSHYEMRGDAPARVLRPRTQGQYAPVYSRPPIKTQSRP